MIWLWGVGGYVFVLLCAVRPVAGHFAWLELDRAKHGVYSSLHRYKERPMAGQWMVGTVVALVVLSVWPLALVLFIVNKHLPTIGAERAQVVEQQRKRIAELEKELDLV